ncbi:CLC_0170 family protein [Brassicibacter mesophilus]|uniref:CLC_0170 family protein n=1 Tax=Brassicibacter mesophilus TaxID=745119 RepID=UPI003D1EEA6C
MSILRYIIYELRTIIDLTLSLSIIAIGLFTFFVDMRVFQARGLKKEANLAKILGIIYIIAGPLLYIVFNVA